MDRKEQKRLRIVGRAVKFGLVVSALSLLTSSPAQANDHDVYPHGIERLSVSTESQEADLYSAGATINSDGNKVSFFSRATNLIANDQNSVVKDVYMRDLVSDTTSIISVNSAGDQCRCQGRYSSLSADGTRVAFNSLDNQGPGHVAEDNNDKSDVYVRNIVTGKTELVSVALDGRAGNNESTHIENYSFEAPSISADGRYVGFLSGFTNLVDNDTNNQTDVFRHDLETDETVRLNISDSGEQANDRSGRYGAPVVSDGGRAAFDSRASNLVASDRNAAEDIFTNR